jgi:NADPH:quinone reductase-like Zn-dependent oxidoreductase
MYRDKRIHPLISGRYTLQDAPQAIAALAERRAQGTLIVLP